MNEEQVTHARDLATVSHAVIKFLGLVFTLPAVYGLFDGSLCQFHLSFCNPLTWRASRPRSRVYGYTGACNSPGARIADAKFAENLRSCHLAPPDATIACGRSRTGQGPNYLCSPTCRRGRAWKRG
jgi:hypothetical protein